MEQIIPNHQKGKVVVVVGSTGTGKSKLSIDLATRFNGEIVNSDKVQVYKGLDIITNKVTVEERRGIPHHLLGTFDPNVDFTADDFVHHASFAVESIMKKGRLPIIAGGSNSYVKALVNADEFQSKYECCFLWLDVSTTILHSFVSRRVDRMVEAGLVDEARGFFDLERGYPRGIKNAIGVPEMDEFFRNELTVDETTRVRLLKLAIDKIKENTCKLCCHQHQKILTFQNELKWNLHRLDATEAFLKRGVESDKAWERVVAGPSSRIVGCFLHEHDIDDLLSTITASPPPIAASSIIAASSVSAVAATTL